MKKHFNQLRESLSKIFTWHKSRIDCLSNLLIGLISSQTVNLSKISRCFKNNNQISSNYRRSQVFFKDVEFDFDAIAEFGINHLLSRKDKLYLVIDRTNWQLGKTNINILMLSAVYEGIAIPLYYDLLDHRGNSDSQFRINLVKRFISKFGKERIACILGDREFIGENWLGWLDSQNIDYIVRIRNNLTTTNSRNFSAKVSTLFDDLAVHQYKSIDGKRKICNQSVYLSGTRAQNGELLIVASNSSSIDNLIPVYAMRWEIENLFQAFKGRGFNLEDTHLTDKNKIAKLIGLLCIAFVWIHKVGEYKDAKIKPIPRKKHGRLQNTYFRYGLDMLINSIQKLDFSTRDFSLCLKILNKTTKLLSL